MTRVPIDRGLVPFLVAVVALASVTISLLDGRRRRAWAAAIPASGAVVVGLGRIVDIEHRVGSSFPRSFYAWAALPLAAIGVAAMEWRRPAPRARVVAVGPTLALLLLGLVEVNAHYAYLPTVGDVIGAPMHDQVPARVATSILTRPAPAPPSHAVLFRTEIPGPASGFRAREGYAWLPPAYFRPGPPRLPLVVMLAGVPGDPSNLLRGGQVAAVADRFAATHGGVAPILLFPDHNGHLLNDTECVDGPRGRSETYLTVDVPAFAMRRFARAVAPPPWGIVGYSEGGTCALTLSLRHPALFGSFVDIGGDLRPTAGTRPADRRYTVDRLYAGDAEAWREHDPLRLLAHRPQVRATFVDGSFDRGPARLAHILDRAATRDGVPARLLTVRGGHSFAMVRRALTLVFPPFAESLVHGATSPARLAS